MALDIQYDVDGCNGTLVRDEEAGVPSVRTLTTWTLFGLGTVVASVSITMIVGRADFAMAAVGGGVLALIAYIRTVDSDSPLAWEPAYQTVRERFEVRQGVLTLHGEEGAVSAELAGAQITAFHDGVWVNPALGKAIRLCWDGATKNDVARLAEALISAASATTRQRGSQRDVPEHLSKLRE